MTATDRGAESAGVCGMIALWKAQEAPLNRNSVSSAPDVPSRGSGQLQVQVGTAAFIASGATNLPLSARPVASMGRLPV